MYEELDNDSHIFDIFLLLLLGSIIIRWSYSTTKTSGSWNTEMGWITIHYQWAALINALDEVCQGEKDIGIFWLKQCDKEIIIGPRFQVEILKFIEEI